MQKTDTANCQKLYVCTFWTKLDLFFSSTNFGTVVFPHYIASFHHISTSVSYLHVAIHVNEHCHKSMLFAKVSKT